MPVFDAWAKAQAYFRSKSKYEAVRFKYEAVRLCRCQGGGFVVGG